MQIIRFQDKEWLLVERSITTEEAYKAGEIAYAYWHRNGFIYRHKKIIGQSNDIFLVREIPEISMPMDGVVNLLTGFLDALEKQNMAQNN